MRPTNQPSVWLSWIAHGTITAIYLSIPFGPNLFAWIALFGSIIGWIAILTHPTKKTYTILAAESHKIFKFWIFICILYLIIHLIQISSVEDLRRLDAPIRIVALSGLAALPAIAQKQPDEYINTLSLSGFIFGGITFIQYINSQGLDRYFGLYGYKNLMALAALVNTIMLLWLLKEESSRIKKFLMLIGILGGIVACLFSGTRASWILIPIIATKYLFMQWNKNISKKLFYVLPVILLVIVIFFPIHLLDSRIQSTSVDINKILTGDRSGPFGLRLLMAEMALDKIIMHPLTGNGLSDFHTEIIRWANNNNLPPHAMERGIQNSHNQFLHWAQSLGIPCALIAVYTLLIWPLKIARNANGASSHILRVFIFACFVFFATEAVLDRHHGSMWYATQLGLILGFILQARQSAVHQQANTKPLT